MIRACSAQDFDSIFEIINDAACAYKGVIPADRWKEPYMPRKALQAELDAGVCFSGFEQHGQLQAVMGSQQVQDVTLIRHAYTRTQERGKGLGKQLLQHLRKKTDRSILIGTWRAADWAVEFYQKQGFRLVSEEEKNRLLRKYWQIPDRQIETSVVLVDRSAQES